MKFIKAHSHQHKIIKCSLSDHFAFRIPVSVVFFYREKIQSDLIEHSLQHVLSDFPVFAGSLIRLENQLHIDCNNQGVPFKAVDADFFFVARGVQAPALPLDAFVDIIDPRINLKNPNPLLTIKLTHCPDGTAVGFCWHHSVGDMATFMVFVKALSEFAQGKPYAPPLVVSDRDHYFRQWLEDRKIIGKKGTCSGLKCLNFIDICRFIKHKISPKKCVYLYFTQEEVTCLKSALRDKTRLPLSRNDALCGQVLNTLTYCRSDDDKTHRSGIIANMRPRLGMPMNVLGNYVDLVPIEFEKEDAVDFIASSIHRAVKNYLLEHFDPYAAWEFVNRNGGTKNIKYMVPESLLPQHKNLIVSNWSNFGVYSIDFGVAAPYFIFTCWASPDSLAVQCG